MLSVGLETMGPKSPERLLRGLGTQIHEEQMPDAQVLTVLVPMTTDQAWTVSLFRKPDGQQILMIAGGNEYAGFSLTCGLPLKTVTIDLQPSYLQPVSKQARLLYAQCKTMPNVIEAQGFH